jgi:hypothetical protein
MTIGGDAPGTRTARQMSLRPIGTMNNQSTPKMKKTALTKIPKTTGAINRTVQTIRPSGPKVTSE